MGSLIMHLCIASKLKEKYHFSDKFLIGALKPDLLKMAGAKQEDTHYLEEVIEESGVKRLPNVLKYEESNKEHIKDEMTLGYISHLVQDKVWFDKYIGKYAKTDANDITKIKYLQYGITKTDKDFSKDIYTDYTNLNKYLAQKYSLDIEKIKNSLKGICLDTKMKEKVDKQFIMKDSNIDKNTFITKQDVESYINDAIKKTSIEIDKILKIY